MASREPEQPRLAPRLGPAPAERHRAPRGRAQAGRRRRLEASCSTPGRTTPSPPSQVADLFRQAEMPDEAIALYQEGDRAGARRRPVSRIPGRILSQPEARPRTLGSLGPDRRRAEPHGKEPGAAGRGPGGFGYREGGAWRRSPRRAGWHPTSSTCSSSTPSLLLEAGKPDDALEQLDARRRRPTRRAGRDGARPADQGVPGQSGACRADRGADQGPRGRSRRRRPSAGGGWRGISRPITQARPGERGDRQGGGAWMRTRSPSWTDVRPDPRGDGRPRRRGRRASHAREARPPVA